MMLTIKCPECSVEGKMSLVDRHYKGPYKCWSCKEFFTIEIANDVLMSCEPLSQEEYNRLYPPKQSDLDAMRTRFQRGGR